MLLASPILLTTTFPPTTSLSYVNQSTVLVTSEGYNYQYSGKTNGQAPGDKYRRAQWRRKQNSYRELQRV